MRCPEPSLRESIVILAVMFALLGMALSGGNREPVSPDGTFQEASR